MCFSARKPASSVRKAMCDNPTASPSWCLALRVSPRSSLNRCSITDLQTSMSRGGNYVTGVSRSACTQRSSGRLEHKEIVGAHPGRGECPVWKLRSQSIQLGGFLIFPRKVVGSNGHSDHSFRPLFQDLAEKISLVLQL